MSKKVFAVIWRLVFECLLPYVVACLIFWDAWHESEKFKSSALMGIGWILLVLVSVRSAQESK